MVDSREPQLAMAKLRIEGVLRREREILILTLGFLT